MGPLHDAPEPVDEDVLADLRARLRATRRVPVVPPAAGGPGWSRGVDPQWLSGLLTDWAAFDWRRHEQRIRSLPWVAREVGGVPVRAVHQRARRDEAPVVVLLHGWPDSVLRFEKVLPLLEDVHVLVPALPGYPFAPALADAERGAMSTTRMADLVAGAVRDLGYQRVTVSGGDIGSSVAESLASRHRDLVGSLHLTDVPYTHLFSVDPGELSEAEQAYLREGRQWQSAEGAYALEQSTKPATLAVALGDSPAGLAAWISEKLASWSDSGGDVDAVFTREELLTWVTAYWVTGAIGTSFAPYANQKEPVDRVDVPTVVTQIPHDLVRAPRSFGERFFDVRVWDDLDSGGHFGAWERPQAFVDGLRRALAVAAG